MMTKNEFSSHSKKDIIMRVILSFDDEFTSNDVNNRLVSDGRVCFSKGSVIRYLKGAEDRYIEVVGRRREGTGMVKVYKVIRG